MACKVRSGEHQIDVGNSNTGPHRCVSALIIFILDTLVKALFILFFNTIFSFLFRMLS